MKVVQGGGLSGSGDGAGQAMGVVEVKVTFRDGGAYEFMGRYERVRERLVQQLEVARSSGVVGGEGDGVEIGRGRGGGALAGVDVGNVHLEDLPVYEAEQTTGPRVGGGVVGEGAVAREEEEEVSGAGADAGAAGFSAPVEPPPGYEEVQRETVQDELERRLGGGGQ